MRPLPSFLPETAIAMKETRYAAPASPRPTIDGEDGCGRGRSSEPDFSLQLRSETVHSMDVVIPIGLPPLMNYLCERPKGAKYIQF